MSDIDPELAWYYGQGRELERLSSFCQLEEFRTRQILSARIDLDRAGLTIVDIGGGAGAYAIWLSSLGHRVTLVEPIGLHLRQAAEAMSTSAPLEALVEADAVALPLEDGQFDMALSLGPLYHLTERAMRLTALRETRRVLRPGGKIFAAAITRYGTIIEGFFKNYLANPEYAAMMRSVLKDGQHRNSNRATGLFTTAFFHRADELRAEVEEAGFADVELVAIEGPWPCIPDFSEKWQDEGFRSLLTETIESIETDESVIGFGGHLMAVATKPGE